MLNLLLLSGEQIVLHIYKFLDIKDICCLESTYPHPAKIRNAVWKYHLFEDFSEPLISQILENYDYPNYSHIYALCLKRHKYDLLLGGHIMRQQGNINFKYEMDSKNTLTQIQEEYNKCLAVLI